MLSHAAVLARLGAWVSPGDVRDILGHLLRVPEAWDQLHNPTFLEAVLGPEAEETLSVNDLAHTFLDAQGEETTPSNARPETPGQFPSGWDTIRSDSLKQRTFERVVQLSQEFKDQWNTGEMYASLIDAIFDAPLAWRSPIACAWKDLNARKKLLAMLLAHNPDTGGILAANTLLANMEPQDAADLLLEATPVHVLPTLLQVLHQHEPAFSALFGATVLAAHSQEGKPQTQSVQSIHHALAGIAAGSITGQIPDPSLEHLEQASSELNAQVADAHALKAQFDHAPGRELQARIDALQSSDTPKRRAALATALAAQDRHAEALDALGEPPFSIEESIVRARIFLEDGQDEPALATLQAIVQQTGESDASPALETVIALLVDLGDYKNALQVANMYSRHIRNLSAFSNIASLCTQAGDPGCGSDFARIAFALQPESASTRHILAQSLEASGEAQEALIHWQALVEENEAPELNVVRCALAAGDLAFSRRVADTILEEDPANVEVRILLGRTLSAAGEFDAANLELELASQQDPQNPEAWIAFAASQQDAGNHDAAGQTLASALQFIPGDPRLNHAYALWLQGQGRISEALEAAEKAYNARPKDGAFQITYGDLLSSLGHHQKALPILRSAVMTQPGNWKAIQTLTKTYEHAGDLCSALTLFSDLSMDAPGEAHLAAARITLRLAGQSDHPTLAMLQRAGNHLKNARARNLQDPALHYWEARCMELEGKSAQALHLYQEILPRTIGGDPDLYLQGLLGVGRTAVAEGQHQVAIETLEAARDRFPNASPLLVELSRAQFKSGASQQALQSAKKASEMNPTDIEPIEQLVQIAGATQSWDPAMDALQRFVALKPLDPMTWLIFAKNIYKAGKEPEATQGLAKALMMGRDNPHLLLEAGQLAHQLQRPSLGGRLLSKALKESHQDSVLLHQIASEAERIGAVEIAANAYRLLADREPEHAETLFHAGHAFWAMGNIPSAIGYWERALVLQPDDPTLIKSLLDGYMIQGKDEGAITLLQAALRASPTNIELLLEAAVFFREQGHIDQALEIAGEALRADPNNTDVILTFSQCLIARGRPDQAIQALNSISPSERSARWHAFLALAKLATDDLQVAEEAFETARGRILSHDDRILVSEIATSLTHWQDALEILDVQHEDSEDSSFIHAELCVRLRAAEAETLYRSAAASNHAPHPEFCIKQAREPITALLNRLRNTPVRKTQLNWVSLRASALIEDGQELMHSRSLAIQDPSGRCLEGLALSSLRRGKAQEALRTLALRDDMPIEGEWFDIITGICQIVLGHKDVAQKALQNAHHHPVLRPLVQAIQSQICSSEGNPEQAKTLLNAALSEWPQEAVWHARLARLYLDDELDDAALPHLQQAAELQPMQAGIHLELARTLYRTGHYSQAAPLYEQVLEEDGAESEIWREAGDVHLALGQAGKASKLFSQACKLHPEDTQTRVGWARAAMMQGDRKMAAAQVKKAKQLAPEDPQVLMAIGEIFASQGKMEDALQAYDEAAQRSENPTDVQLARAKLHMQSDNPEAAVKELSMLASQNQDVPDVWSALAEAQEAAEDFTASLQSIGIALRLSPHAPIYRLQLGRLSRKTGQLDRALDELTRLERSTPRNSQVQIELGRLYEARRQYQDALQAYQQASLVDPGNSQAPFLTGMVLKHLKDYAGACEMFERAVELAPHDPETVHQLAAVRALQLVHGGYSKTAVTI